MGTEPLKTEYVRNIDAIRTRVVKDLLGEKAVIYHEALNDTSTDIVMDAQFLTSPSGRLLIQVHRQEMNKPLIADKSEVYIQQDLDETESVSEFFLELLQYPYNNFVFDEDSIIIPPPFETRQIRGRIKFIGKLKPRIIFDPDKD